MLSVSNYDLNKASMSLSLPSVPQRFFKAIQMALCWWADSGPKLCETYVGCVFIYSITYEYSILPATLPRQNSRQMRCRTECYKMKE